VISLRVPVLMFALLLLLCVLVDEFTWCADVVQFIALCHSVVITAVFSSVLVVVGCVGIVVRCV